MAPDRLSAVSGPSHNTSLGSPPQDTRLASTEGVYGFHENVGRRRPLKVGKRNSRLLPGTRGSRRAISAKGQGAAVTGRRMAQPIYPQLRKYPMRSATCVSCQRQNRAKSLQM